MLVDKVGKIVSYFLTGMIPSALTHILMFLMRKLLTLDITEISKKSHALLSI
jgi:hypothetical protein